MKNNQSKPISLTNKKKKLKTNQMKIKVNPKQKMMKYSKTDINLNFDFFEIYTFLK